MRFEESGITFSFEDSDRFPNVWLPEKSDLYRKMKGVKIGDFVLQSELKDEPILYFTEVKSSIPMNKEKLDNYLNDITQKFRDSLSFFASMCWKRRLNEQSEPFPELWRRSQLLRCKWICVLVIPEAPNSKLPTLNDKLNLHPGMKAMTALYKLEAPKVINRNLLTRLNWVA